MISKRVTRRSRLLNTLSLCAGLLLCAPIAHADEPVRPDPESIAADEAGLKRGETQAIATIDWDEAYKTPSIPWSRVSSKDATVLATSSVPVLVPDTPALLDALFVKNTDWYTASVPIDGAHVYVMGNRAAYLHPELRAEAEGKLPDVQVTRIHGIVTVMWQAFGAAYTLDVECADPLADARCTEDAFALQLVQDLVLLGGPSR